MGLNEQAAADIDGLISTGHQAVAGFTLVGNAFLVLCALGFASTLQGWYERVYDQPTSTAALGPGRRPVLDERAGAAPVLTRRGTRRTFSPSILKEDS